MPLIQTDPISSPIHLDIYILVDIDICINIGINIIPIACVHHVAISPYAGIRGDGNVVNTGDGNDIDTDIDTDIDIDKDVDIEVNGGGNRVGLY